MATVVPHKTMQLFSERSDLGPAVAQTVRRIAPAKDQGRFATDFIGVAGADGAAIIATALEAWQDESTGLWGIDRLSYTAALNAVRKSTEAHAWLCFFDALDICARFQVAEMCGHDKREIIAVPEALLSGAVHYSAAATAANQVVDGDGYVQPCASGRILTDGTYSVEAMEIARSTKSVPATLPLPALPSVTHAVFGDLAERSKALSAETMPENGNSDRKYENRQNLINNFRDVVQAGDALMKGLSSLVNREFRTEFQNSEKEDYYDAFTLGQWTYLKSIVSLGIVPTVGYLRGNRTYSTDRHFFVLKRAFDKGINLLPDCPEKKLTREFSAAAESTLWLERAALIQERVRDGKRPPSDATGKGCRMIAKACQAAGLSQIESHRLLMDYRSDSFYSGQFLRGLRNTWGDDFYGERPEDLKSILDAKINHVRRGGPG